MNLSGRNLSLGLRGDDVGLLQSELSALGYYIFEDETGPRYFGETTRAAVLTFQGRNGIARTGIVDTETAQLINDRYDALTPVASLPPLIVQGRVFDSSGAPLAGVIVTAVDRDLRTEQQLGPAPSQPTITDPTGFYSITYTRDQFARAEKRSADIVVYAFQQVSGNPPVQIGHSDVYFNVPDTVEINVTADPPPTGATLVSEFERVGNEVNPLLDQQQNVALTDLNAADVQFIAGETELPAVRIALYVAAAKLNAQNPTVAAAAFYGMAREGLPSAIDRLLLQGRAAQQRALEAAVDGNIVPASIAPSIPAILDALAALAVGRAITPSTVAGHSSLGDLLTAGGVAQQQQQPFASAWLAWDGPVRDFWTSLTTQGFDAPTVAKIQLSLQFGALTQHAKVVQALVAANVPSLRELAKWDATQWSTFIQGLADQNGNLPIPADIPGANNNDKLANYSALLVRIVEQTFPAPAYVRPLRQNPSQADSDLIAFVDGNPSFDLERAPIDAYLLTAASLPNDPARKAALVDRLKKTQRLFRLKPTLTELRAIEQAGLGSATAITRGGRANFVAQFSNSLGVGRANAIYDQAEHAASIALNLFARFAPAANGLGLPVLPTPAQALGQGQGMFADQIATPDYASLFGSPDFCACSDCRSVLGPAAYLVDLLHFLSRYSALDKLLDPRRRPDLATTELSCDNTNVELPYIDLVNEVLEASIAGASSRQTLQPAEVLAVEPQFEDLRAWDTVARDVYPWSLPFDLGAARARAFLGQLDVRRDELMGTFRGPGGASDLAVDGETLGMTPFEVRLATGGLTLGPTVDAATTQEITLSSGQLVDGVNITAGQLVLVKDQTDKTKNGVYLAQEVDWIRAAGVDGPSNVRTGLVVPVAGGQVNGKKSFVLTTAFTINIGADPINFALLPSVASAELNFVPSVRAATTGPIAAANVQPIDGVPLVAGDRVLVKDQADARLNGFYQVVDNGAWTRTNDPLGPTFAVAVTSGDTNAGRRFAVATVPVYAPGVTALDFKATTADDADVLSFAPWRYWGYSQQPNNLLGDLSTVSTLLAKAGMSYDDLTALLATRYVNPTGSIAVTFSGTSCALDKATINLSDLATLRRIQRFERVRRKLGWSAAEVDHALTALAQPEITDAFIARAAEIERLRRRFRLSVDQVIAFWAFVPSLYPTVYQNPKTTVPVDSAFALNNDGSALAAQGQTIAAHRVAILAALGLSARDFALLTAGDANVPAEVTTDLSLDNLWKLYRATSLARALGLGIRDFLYLKALTGIDPFGLATTRRFADSIAALEATGLTVDELTYLVRVLPDRPPPVAPSFDAAGVVVRAIRDGVAKIAADNVAPADFGALQLLVRKQLTQILAPADVATTIEILNLTSSLAPDAQHTFIDALFNGILTFPDTTLTGQNPLTDVPARWEYMRAGLAPYLVKTLGRALVKERLGDAFRLSPASVELLLTRYQPSGQPAIELYFDPTFLATTGAIDPDQSGLQLVPFYWLHKVSLVAARLGLDADTLKAADGLAVRLPSLWIDFTALPIADQIPHGSSTDLFSALLRLADFVRVRGTVPTQRTTLDQIFSMASDHAQENDLTNVLPTVVAATGWPQADVTALAARLGLVRPVDLQSTAALSRLAACVDALRHLGVPADEAIAHFVADAVTIDDGDAAKRAAKAKYDGDAWAEIAKPIQDQLREAKRDALVAHHLGIGYASEKVVFDTLLIDVEMSACMMTSRIKQAISSAQLFIQRALLNLEQNVTLDAEARREWSWMRAYRLWEANRQVFLYPENWIDPTLRDDKSPFFDDLETELMQHEVTDAAARDAFYHYLEQVDGVARVEVTGFYREVGQDSAGPIDVLHVFGRTSGVPQRHVYRQLVDGRWTAWEDVSLDIPGDRVMPLVYNRRLHLYWPVITKKSDPDDAVTPDSQTKTAVDKAVTTGKQTYLEIKIAWSELRNGKWMPKRVSNASASTRSLLNAGFSDATISDEDNFVFKVVPDRVRNRRDVLVRCFIFAPSKAYNVTDFRFSGALSDQASVQPGIETEPTTDGFGGPTTDYFLLPPPGTTIAGNTFLDQQNHDGVLPPLSLYRYSALAAIEGTATDGTITDVTEAVPVLASTPSTYRLVPPHQDLELIGNEFFFQDAKRSYYVAPVTTPPGRDWGDTNAVPPDIGDQVRGAFYATTPAPAADSGLIVDGGANGDQVYADALAAGGTALAAQPLFANTLQESDQFEEGVDVIAQVLDPSVHTAQAQSPKAPPANQNLFQSFYHPYASEFLGQVNRQGMEGLLRREVEQLPSPNLQSPEQRFTLDYQPQSDTAASPFPKEDVDFDWQGAYAQYNWEIFFHAPFEIATRLMGNQRFEEARNWLHAIFDPTDPTGGTDAGRFWKFKPFVDEARGKTIQELLALLGDDGKDPALKAAQEALEHQVIAWRKDPFNPHLIARSRPSAYAKAIVMKYIDNLIAWGDQLFQQNTIESINEATQLYVLASELLGPRPTIVERADGPGNKTYQDLASLLDAFSDALVDLENGVAPQKQANGLPQQPHSLGNALYFCVPPNEKLLGYWDTVEDRLFKIRHCQNIQGLVQQLPLFEPPIDPALLVRAQAAGVDLTSALSDVTAAVPFYRFQTMLQRAIDFAGEVRSLGAALLSALEKSDGEQLATMRSGQEKALLTAVRDVKQRAVDEASTQVEALQLQREVVQTRYDYYASLGPWLPAENKQVKKLSDSLDHMESAHGAHMLGSIVREIPELITGVSGLASSPVSELSIGGAMFAGVAELVATAYNDMSQEEYASGQLAGTSASYLRRAADWKMQADAARKELEQVDKQIAAAQIRLAMAEHDLANQDLQIANAQAVDDFLHTKYTNQSLYDWMASQVANLYFSAYQLAYDVAKRAERAFRFERPDVSTTFINFGYWDSLKRGLLAGERLQLDLRRMEIAHVEQNRRELEITKHVSLADFAPDQLIDLRERGICSVRFDESFFDADYPGHYMRRLKSVSITIPCVTGPYTGVNARLALGRNQFRINTVPQYQAKYALQPVGDPRGIFNVGGVESIATSSAQADGGLFELNFRDERFLPFEGAGADSAWTLTMPRENNRFDFNSITDVVFHLRYAARDGGDALRTAASTALNAQTPALSRLFSAKADFADAWEQFWDATPRTFAITLDRDQFRFPPPGKLARITGAVFVWKFKDRPLPGQQSSPATAYSNGLGQGKKIVLTVPNPNGNPTDVDPEYGGLSTWTSQFANELPGSNPWSIVADLSALDPSLQVEDAVEDLMIVVQYTEA